MKTLPVDTVKDTAADTARRVADSARQTAGEILEQATALAETARKTALEVREQAAVLAESTRHSAIEARDQASDTLEIRKRRTKRKLVRTSRQAKRRAAELAENRWLMGGVIGGLVVAAAAGGVAVAMRRRSKVVSSPEDLPAPVPDESAEPASHDVEPRKPKK